MENFSRARRAAGIFCDNRLNPSRKESHELDPLNTYVLAQARLAKLRAQ
ncbi:hypothetical protein SAMN05421771_0890 [Granulicella pectinivorans]|uniref:Uncharacterized protein n=1 Tax=Granulicella pectinivorans TaxID=474950 RepID=A0A1I6LLS8_9BACT|nr:hypothetical protein [Granulicella pectinivorans]SFS04280.1 hypothetical protein SAMN05421771_0890 [Granulicella pectinivorans]